MRVLVLGSGGREHALAWALGQSPGVERVLCAPGSDGIARDAEVLPLDLSDLDACVALARGQSVDLVVVGPEAPLAAGVADRLRAAGIAVFGPESGAARLEASKVFAKEFMRRHGIPTADFRTFGDLDQALAHVRAQARPLVIKADGLAAGKGVQVCSGARDAERALLEIMRDRRFGESGARVVIEEVLVGEEASFHVLCDASGALPLAPAQDFKRALEGDAGENTGGMGAYSPAAIVDPEVAARVMQQIVEPLLAGMRAEGCPYRGVLYVGLMIHEGQPSVVEFNVRFGDPETQPLLFRLESDLADLLYRTATDRLHELPPNALRFGPAALCVVMASEGYPRSHATGFVIEGLDEVDALSDVKVFHAGTRLEQGRWVTAGGRILGVTARGESLALARERAYAAVDSLRIKGAQFRRDIGAKAVAAASHRPVSDRAASDRNASDGDASDRDASDCDGRGSRHS